MNRDVDVLIIGVTPAGLLAGEVLQRKGYSTAVVMSEGVSANLSTVYTVNHDFLQMFDAVFKISQNVPIHIVDKIKTDKCIIRPIYDLYQIGRAELIAYFTDRYVNRGGNVILDSLTDLDLKVKAARSHKRYLFTYRKVLDCSCDYDGSNKYLVVGNVNTLSVIKESRKAIPKIHHASIDNIVYRCGVAGGFMNPLIGDSLIYDMCTAGAAVYSIIENKSYERQTRWIRSEMAVKKLLTKACKPIALKFMEGSLC